MFRAIKQHVTGTYHGKQMHGINLLIAYNKSPLLTMSQKGSEDMMAPTLTWQVILQIHTWQEQNYEGMLVSLYHSPQSNIWHGKATNSKKACL